MKQPPIPETDQWEAKGLCALLNNLERERDELKALLTKKHGTVTISRNGYVQEIERELAEARGQRDRLAKALELFLNRVQYTSVFMDGELKGGKFDCLSSGFDSEVKEADAALKSLTPNKTLSQ